MTSSTEELYVRTHVSRDLLQSAGLFKNEHLVVWEYVSNGLQYVDGGTNPVVRVKLDSKGRRISVEDNGRGMSFSDLQNFFVMHGENVDRKAGHVGRGMFGTGKSAAFGIAETLIVTTVRFGKRSKVSLNRSHIESMSNDSPIPVTVNEKGASTAEPNGTLIEIEGVQLRNLDQKRVIHFIERHLAHWPRNVTVRVNNHECQYAPPIAVQTETIQPQGDLAKMLGNSVLTLRVAAGPLAEDDRGIAISSRGVWHETTLAGSENREMATFIFGEIDVPGLDEDKSSVAPFDMSRSMRLNPASELVQAIMGFLGTSVEALRKKLVAQERERKASEDAKRLAKQADEIAKLINEDFSEFRRRVAKARASGRGGEDTGQREPEGGDKDDDFLSGGDEAAEIVKPTGEPGADGDNGSRGGPPRRMNPEVRPGRQKDPKVGKPAGGQATHRQNPRGGFSIDFRNMGEAENRAKYHRDERQIVINLDHPQFRAAIGSGTIEDLTFRRLAYEVAFSEYALALAFELAQRDEYMDITDPIVDISETINRVARRAASLYEAP